MMIVIPLLSLLGLSAVAAFCPYHCSCNDVTMTVDCPQQAELDIIPITLNPMIKSLGLAQNRIRSIDASLQFYGHLEFADFSSNQIEFLPEKCFSSQKRLLRLLLDKNRIANLTRASFVGLESLQHLSLRDNRLVNLTAELFQHLKSIESLDLSHNAISFVHARAFDLATNLRSLDMSGNRLQTTSLSTFQPLQSLQSLNLAFNSNFSSLPSRSFSSLEALASLNLSSCGLTSVSTDTFIGLSSSLVVLDLSNNSIESSDELGIRYLDSLQQLFAGRNRIQVMRRGCFKELSKLSSLDLSDTRSLLKIEDLAFVGNSALSNLILDGCDGLSMLESKALASSSTIDSGNERQLHLSLRRQRWSHLPSYMEKLSWDQVSSIDLSDNPLECDCHVAWLNKLLVSTQGSSSLVNASNIPCAFPADLAGLELAQLNASQLICEQEKEVSHMFNPSTRAPGDLFQIILVSVCVLTALLTGLVVLFVVHCRKQRCRIKSLFRRRGDHQDMAFDSPLDNCSCCDIRANGKLLRLQPPSLHGGDHFFRHDGHQPLRPASAFYLDNGHGSIYRPSYNGHSLRQGHLSRGKIRQQIHQTETNPRHSSRFEEESDFFNTLNSKSTLCLDEEQDDYFLSFSASREHTYVRPIPVSEL